VRQTGRRQLENSGVHGSAIQGLQRRVHSGKHGRCPGSVGVILVLNNSVLIVSVTVTWQNIFVLVRS